MKLLTFRKDGHDHLGAVRDDAIVDLTTALSTDPRFGSMQALIEGGDDALTQAAATLAHTTQTLPADQVEWRAPLPRPPQLRDFLSFELHLKNSFEAALKLAAQEADDPVAAEATLRASGRFNIPDVWYRQPIYYKGNRFAVAATGEDIPWPAYSKVMDYELELACVIGHAGRDIPRDQAHEHIFGYTVFNDFSARDAQVAEQQGMLGPAKGKDFDKANVLGPVIVTRDEIPDPYQLAMRARVNGELRCDGHSSTMHWTFADMIAHVSRGETLHAGEVIGSGTVGWGCGLEHLKFLEAGDTVELEIEGIGVLRNRVVRLDD